LISLDQSLSVVRTMEASGSTRPAVLLVLLFSLLMSLAAATEVSGKAAAAYVVYLGDHSRRDGVLSPEEASRRAADAHRDLLGAVLGE
jgi:hypothetical protein